MRQDAKRLLRNKVAKAELHSLRVKLRKFVAAGKNSEAMELARSIVKKMDKAVSRGIFKKNTVTRLKSRMMKKLSTLKSK